MLTTKDAFDLWKAGRLEEAAACYREALAATPADDDSWRGEAHSELAGVLQDLGDHAGALYHLQAAVDTARRCTGSDAPLEVVITRYFLADQLRRQGKDEEALAAIAPSIDAGAEKAWGLYAVEAEALLALGRRDYAVVAAERALTLAPSAATRTELAARFAAAGLDADR